MIGALRYRSLITVMLFIGTAGLLLFLFARCNIKKESTESLFDATEKACLYSYGLGLTENKNWLGRVTFKIVDFYPSGRVATEYFYDRDGNICKGTGYYETGEIENTGSMTENNAFGQILDDGITQEYYKNGQLKAEYGRRPGGCCIIFHGINRTYSEDGKLIVEQYFINDNECSSTEWMEWLKKHPADIKYSDRDHDEIIKHHHCIAIVLITSVIGVIIIFWKYRMSSGRKRNAGMKSIYSAVIIIVMLFFTACGIYFTFEFYRGSQTEAEELFVNAVKCCDLEKLKTLYKKYPIDLKKLKHKYAPLLFAVLYSNAGPDKIWDTMNFMLSKGCDINARDEYHTTFLISCINRKLPPDVIEKVIEAGADVRLKDYYGNTALHAAVFSENPKENAWPLKYAELLLRHGSGINEVNSSGSTPLSLSAASGNIDIIGFLIEKGANLNQAEKGCEPALYAAAQNGHDEAVNLLIERGAVINVSFSNNLTPLSVAMFNKHKKTVKLLIEKGADLKQEGNHRVLGCAVSQNDYDFAKYLISKGAYMNGTESSESPLSEAAARGNSKMVKLLLDNGANPNIGVGMPPLVYSILYADHEIAKLLLLHGANPDAEYKNGPSPRKLIEERIADPLFAREKEAYKKILEMMEKGKSRK